MSDPYKVDMRGPVGIYLRGKNVYKGTSHSPNPTGRNQYKKLARTALKKRKKNG